MASKIANNANNATNTTQSAPNISMNNVECVLMCDGTESMQKALQTICNMLSEFLAVAEILGLNLRVCYYRDYDVDMDGGYKITPRGATYDEMKAFVQQNSIPYGGGGLPEAQKTAFEMLLRDDAPLPGQERVIVHFTDAQPHPDQANKLDRQGKVERSVFEERQWLHGNWNDLCNRVKQSAHTVITFSNQRSYDTMGPNLGQQYPTTQEMMDMVFLMIGAETGANPAPRLAPVANLLPRVDVGYAVKTMDKFELLTIFQNVLRDCPQALPTNNILGTAWRRVCTMKHDKAVKSQVETLCNMLSKAIDTLPAAQAASLRQWVEDSYDCENELKELVSSEWVEGAPMIYIDAYCGMARKTLMDLLRECKCSPEVMKMFGLCEIGVIKGPSPLEGGTLQCLPLSLSPREILCALPSLVVHGTMFSQRGSLINAVLSRKCLHLCDISERHLIDNIGWVDHSVKKDDPTKGNVPENFSPLFLHTLCTIPPEDRVRLLGEDTTAKLDTFQTLSQVLRNMDATVKYTRPCQVSAQWKINAKPDHKFRCSSCGVFRSETNRAVYDPPTCGLCHCIATNMDTGDFTMDLVEARVEPEHTSLLTSCRTCNHWYAVTCVDHLNVEPKCHDCRVNAKSRYHNTCGLCFRSFVSPTIDGVVANYTCAQCDSGDLAVMQKDTTVSAIMASSPNLWRALGLEPEVGSKLKTMSMPTLISTLLGEIDEQLEVELNVDGVKVINSTQVSTLAVKALLTGDGRDVCACCASEVKLSQLDSFCGNDSCTIRACGSCIKEWYGQSKSGSIVYQAHFSCPYCKQKPTGTVVRKYAGHLRDLKGSSKIDWSVHSNDYILWCNTCNELKTFAPRGECGDAPAPNITGHSCRDCRDAAAAREAMEAAAAIQTMEEYAGEQFPEHHDYGYVPEYGANNEFDDSDNVPRQCPTCGIEIVKNGGCDHIECICGAHICWQCMSVFDTADECYDHIYDDLCMM